MIHIVLGPDYALARHRVNEIRRAADPDGNSSSTLDGRTVTIRAVINDIASIGFFSAGRVVIVEDLLARLGKPGARDGSKPPDWAALFGAVPTASTLILLDVSLTAVPAAVKKALPEDAEVSLSQPPRANALLAWLQACAARHQSSMDRNAAQQLAMSLYPQSWANDRPNPAYDRPPDMELLENEIARLALAAYPNPITAQIVRDNVAVSEDDKIFEFLDAASRGNLPIALQQLEKLMANGEDPAKLFAQLSGQVELSALTMAAHRQSPAQIAKAAGATSEGRIRALQRALQGRHPAGVFRAVRIADQADAGLKRGEMRDPLDALYALILGIATQPRR